MITLWHNPRCSKSRQTLALIEARGIDVAVRLYLQDKPDANELRLTRDTLGLRTIDMMRTNETVFKQLGLTRDSSDDDLLAAMAQHPILIERPILFANSQARIGRPPEQVLEIL